MSLIITEVDQGHAFAQDLFYRKYRQPIPVFAHHIVAFGQQADGAFRALSYLHLTDVGDLMLAGGAATDGDAIRSLPIETQTEIARKGGLMNACLQYGIERYGPAVEGIAACCGDPRALEVTPLVGLDPTSVQHLLMRWSRPLPEPQREALLAKAQSFMPF